MSILVTVIVTADILLTDRKIYLNHNQIMFDAVHQFTMNNKRFSNSSMELSDLFNIYRLHQITPITQLLWPKDKGQHTKNRATHTLK